MAVGGEKSAQVVDIRNCGYRDGRTQLLIVVNGPPTIFKPTSPFKYAGSRCTYITKHLFQF